MTRQSLRAAINAKCKTCIYDPYVRGNWREQVSHCPSANCPLHPLRPISGPMKRELCARGEKHRGDLISRLHGVKKGLPSGSFLTSEGDLK